MFRLDLLNVGLVDETDAVLVVLRDPQLARLVVIETGPLEGQAIALEAQGVRAERPLTADLLYEIVDGLGARVEEVRIEDVDDEAFYAKVILSRAVDGSERLDFDARPSDAIALAMRAGAPIFASDRVMQEAGIPEAQERKRLAALYSEEDFPPGDGTVH